MVAVVCAVSVVVAVIVLAVAVVVVMVVVVVIVVIEVEVVLIGGLVVGVTVALENNDVSTGPVVGVSVVVDEVVAVVAVLRVVCDGLGTQPPHAIGHE